MKQNILLLQLWKKRPIVACSVLALFLLAVLAVRCAMPCREYSYEGEALFEAGERKSSAVYSGIVLDPGVYLLKLRYAVETEEDASCGLRDGTVMTGGLLSNGEALYSGLDETGFTFWLLEPTENLEVVVDNGGEGRLETGGLVIRETRQLWTMLISVCFFFWLLACASLSFWYYDKAYHISREKKQAIFWVAAVGFIASLFQLCGYHIAGADLTYHLQRVEGVRDGLLGGQFPVRIEPRWVFGHGYADAIFYCNALLYFPAIMRLLGFTVCTSYNAYCILLNLMTAWVSYYCFSRMLGRSAVGLVCSGLYTLSIFRIYKLVCTGAVGEGTAFLFLPLVLYGLCRIFTENPQDRRYKTAWIPLMLGYAGLIQSHILTCEITAFVTLVYCLFHIRRVFVRNTFLALCKGVLGAALVSLWFLVPFLDYYLTQDMHLQHVYARTIQDRGLYPAQLAFHYWTVGSNASMAEAGMQYSHPVGIGFVLTAGLGLFFAVWFSGRFRKEEAKLKYAKATFLAGILLLFMSLKCFPWDRIQSMGSVAEALVSSLQFPNRFLGWATVCAVFVFGYCMKCFEGRALYAGLAACAALSVATSSMYLTDYVNRDQGYFEIYDYAGMGFGYISGAEYLIQGTDQDKLTFSRPEAGEGVAIKNYEKNYLHTVFDCVNSSGKDSFVELPVLLYKGYRAIDAASGQALAISPGSNQNICVQIPAGYSGRVDLDFVSPFYWRLAEAASLSAIVLIAAIVWKYRRMPCRG